MTITELIDKWIDLANASRVVVKISIYNHEKKRFEEKVDILDFNKDFKTITEMFDLLKNLYQHETVNCFYTDRIDKVTYIAHIRLDCRM